MFGYLRPYKPELKIKDFSVYKAVYCGICDTIGKRYGLLSRMFLSYDATLICILDMATEDNCCGFEERRCPLKPMKKCDFARQNPAMEYWAAANVILGFYKVKDNLEDGGFLKKTASVLAYPAAFAGFKKAAKRQPFIADRAKAYLENQKKAELENTGSVDAAAQPTAQFMSELLVHRAKSETEKRIFERMGTFIGRWIYFSDAADDIKQDFESGNYNPFLRACELNGSENRLDAALKLAQPLLNSCISEIRAALQLLDIKHYGDILGNAFYLGLPKVKEAVLSGLCKKEKMKRFSAVYRI